VGGRRDANIPGGHYVALGEHLGVRARAARAVMDRVAGSADMWLDSLADLPFDKGSITKLKRDIRNRQKVLRLG
jgi:hypothetical protein